MKPLTILLTASGVPGSAALIRALRENGERDIRLVGADMAELAIGRHLCDAFYVVPPKWSRWSASVCSSNEDCGRTASTCSFLQISASASAKLGSAPGGTM